MKKIICIGLVVIIAISMMSVGVWAYPPGFDINDFVSIQQESHSDEEESSEEIEMGDIIPIVCFAGAAVLIIAAVVILVVTFRKKPGQKAEKPSKTKTKNQKPAGSYAYANYQDDEKTQAVRQPASGGITYEIRLISLNNLNDTWTLNITGEVLAGRSEYASIRFDDKSVSREQFRIIATASGLAVVHCGSTNKTTVNDQLADNPLLIKAGDVIKFGREAVRVDYVQPYVPGGYQNPQPMLDAGWQQPSITETQYWKRS